MKYEKNSKEADKGAGKVAVLGSTEGSADAHYGGNSGDEDDGDAEDEGSVDEYGNNKYIKGAYEAHGDDSDDLRDPRIVNEYSDDEDEEEEEEVRAPVRKQKANQKNAKRSRSQAEDRDESFSDDDHAEQDGDLKAQEEKVLKLLRTA